MQNGMSSGNDSYIEEFYETLWNDTVLHKCKELQN